MAGDQADMAHHRQVVVTKYLLDVVGSGAIIGITSDPGIVEGGAKIVFRGCNRSPLESAPAAIGQAHLHEAVTRCSRISASKNLPSIDSIWILAALAAAVSSGVVTNSIEIFSPRFFMARMSSTLGQL